MKDKTTKIWIPLYVDKWIFGSTRIELEPAERAVFIDILAFGAKDNGYIRANETTPYHHSQLAGLLNIPVELLQSTLAKCIHFGKLKEGPPGIYKLINWDEYQLTDRHKRRFDPMSENEDTMSPKPDPIVKESRVEESREKKKKEDTRTFVPPTIDELRPYCQEMGVNADKWLAHYQSNGWMVGRSKMKDWKAAVRTWTHSSFAAPAPEKPKGRLPNANDISYESPPRYDGPDDCEVWGVEADGTKRRIK